MSAVPHLGFIVAAYGVTAAVLGMAIVALVLDRRTQARLLTRFGRTEDRTPGDQR